MLKKMELNEKRIEDENKKKHNELIIKQEDNYLKQYEKNQIIKRLHKVKEYKSQKKNKEILEKEKKIEDFKKQKQKVLESKAKMSEQINKEKMELIYKFEKAMGKRKQIKPSLVKKLFPNDEKLYSKVKAMTDSVYKKDKNKSCDDVYKVENSNEYIDANEVDDKGTYITQDKKKKKVGNKSY